MSTRNQLKWTQFLRNNGIHVTARRGYARWKALRDCLLAESFQPSNKKKSHVTYHADAANAPAQNIHNDSVPKPTRDDNPTTGRRASATDTESSVVPSNGAPSPSVADVPALYKEFKNKMNISPLSVSNTSHATGGQEGSSSDRSMRPDGSYSRKNGVEALMRAYTSRSKFSGSFTEDFDGAIEEFETLSIVCNLTEEDMAIGFPIMLMGPAFSHFSRNYSKKSMTYSELKDAFRAWYTSEEQRYRLLHVWQSPSLTQDMRNNPDKSELEVFREVSDNLTRVQHQLHKDYHHDRFLRDQLLRAADLPHLRRSLIEKIPATAQEAMQRIATLLSSEPRSAGANFVNDHADGTNLDEVHYGLGKRFGGNAKKHLRGYSSRHKKSSRAQKLASVKGCWVCGADHKARDHHNKNDILDALNRIKNQQSQALYSGEHVAEMVSVFLAYHNESDGESSEGDSDSADMVNYLSSSDIREIEEANEAYLANNAFIHGSVFSQQLAQGMKKMEVALQMGEETRFEGIILDTGANRRSAMSIKQYKAYCREFHVPFDIDYQDNHNLLGIGGQGRAIGTATIPIPFVDLDIVIDVKFRILDTNCPNLLSLRDMKENGLDMSIQKNVITYKHKIQDLSVINDFLMHKWTTEDMEYALYTEKELKRLHRVFGHPSVVALQNLLKRANPDEFGPELRQALEEISSACGTCATYASKPRRFKITIGIDDLRFNHVLAVDVMYIRNKPILHVVDEATHYAAATFLRSMSAEDTWKALLRCWIRTYLGPPDHLRVDQGSNFISKHFLASADAEGIKVLEAPIESPSTMSHVERYHKPLRAAYMKIRDSLPKTETDSDCLKLAVKAVNDTVGPEGLCPTLLVYGAIPRPPRRTPADTQIERARALDQATKEVQKEQAKRRVAFALRHPCSPKAKEQEAKLEKLPAGAAVLVYRDKTKTWQGPFPFVSIQDNTVVVQLPTGRKIFRSMSVKPAPRTTATASWQQLHNNTAEESYVLEDGYVPVSQ